jgi:hypothetical protein
MRSRFAARPAPLAVVMLVWAAAGASAEIRSPDGNPHSRFRFTFEDPPVVLAATPGPILPVQAPPPDRERRPPALVPLYFGFGALQGLDVHATTRASIVGQGSSIRCSAASPATRSRWPPPRLPDGRGFSARARGSGRRRSGSRRSR